MQSIPFFVCTIIYQVFSFIFIQSSFIPIGVRRSRSFCNQFLFFVGLNFLSSLTTRKLTWYLAFLTRGDMLTTHNPHFTKIFTYFRPVSQKKKKKTPKSNFQFCLFFVVLSQLMSLAIVHKRK